MSAENEQKAIMLMARTLNRLCKWRTIFVGWQLGTRAKGDPEADALRDHRELTMILRAEVTALSKLLADKKVFTVEEYCVNVANEAQHINKGYEDRFPGVRALDDGLEMDFVKINAAGWMKGWRP